MTSQPPPSLERALNEALADECRARALYGKVIEAFGPVRPFVNIVEAERNHIEELLPLFWRYGFPVPKDDQIDRSPVPTSLLKACRDGVRAEIDNVAMYDRLIAAVADFPDVHATFLRLRAASRDRHLPAFERCVAREGGERGEDGGPGRGRGPGRGGGCGGGGCGGGRHRGGGRGRGWRGGG